MRRPTTGFVVRDFLRNAPDGGSLCLELEETTATLWLDHPRRMNSFSGAMMVELDTVVKRLEGWGGSLLVIRGREHNFCAGADLRLMRSHFSQPQNAARMHDWMSGLLRRIQQCPFVSVSLVEGVALGGGAELAVSTDHRVMTEDAQIRFLQVARGVSPGWGGAERLRGLIGYRRALRVLTSGEPISAEGAKAIGLVDEIVPDAEKGLQKFVAPILSHSARAVRANKAALMPQLAPEASNPHERAAFLSTLTGANMADVGAAGDKE